MRDREIGAWQGHSRGRGGIGKVLFLVVLFVLAMIASLGQLAHGQGFVDVSQFPGATKGEKLSNAMTQACAGASSTKPCILTLPPEMATYSDGTGAKGYGLSGTLGVCAFCIVIDYAVSSGGMDVWGTGAMSLPTNFGNRARLNSGGFNGKSLQVNESVFSSEGLKHQRFGGTCATAATAGAACTTVMTWTAAFPNSNYTAVCSGRGATNAAILNISSKASTTVTVQVIAATAAAASFSAVECIAFHD
jgi:hypothetical protein